MGRSRRTVENSADSIQEGVDLEMKDEQYDHFHGSTPLEIAISNSNYAITKLLVKNGALVNTKQWSVPSALYQALHHKSCQDFIRDYETKDELKSKALRAVAKMGHKELVDLVTRKDQVVDISFYEPVWSILVRAVNVCESNISIIRLLLEKEIKKEYVKTMLLTSAHPWCCDVTLKLLVERKSIFGGRNLIDQDALGTAASYGQNSMINLILESGANPNTIDRCYRTPLMWAAHSGHVNTVKLLLKMGADAKMKFAENETALLLAREGLSHWKLYRYKLFFQKQKEANTWKDFGSRQMQLSCWQEFCGKEEQLSWWQDKKGKANVAKLLLKQGVKE